MELVLKRYWYGDKETIGELYVDGAFQCYTLEDVVRSGPKVPGETAIPAGSYALDMTYSYKFNMVLPLLKNVPGFAGIRIHAGNTHQDTEGCILFGRTTGRGAIGDSRTALGALLGKIQLPAQITIEEKV